MCPNPNNAHTGNLHQLMLFHRCKNREYLLYYYFVWNNFYIYLSMYIFFFIPCDYEFNYSMKLCVNECLLNKFG